MWQNKEVWQRNRNMVGEERRAGIEKRKGMEAGERRHGEGVLEIRKKVGEGRTDPTLVHQSFSDINFNRIMIIYCC